MPRNSSNGRVVPSRGPKVLGARKKRGELFPKMGRPEVGPMGTYPSSVRDACLDMRKGHGGWGARTILTELSLAGCRFPLPCASSVRRLLRSHGLLAPREPNRPAPSDEVPRRPSPHDLWQIDDMGAEYHAGIGHVSLVGAKDVGSRSYAACLAVAQSSSRGHPSGTHYVTALRAAFAQCGLPKGIQSDNGSIFVENGTKSPFPTPLHLWLCGLGICFSRSRKHRPTDQAFVERSHRTMYEQVRRTAPYKNIGEFQDALDERRQRLNNHIVCSSIKGAPYEVFPEARHSKRHYSPETEAQLFDIQRIYDMLDGREWFRYVSKDKTFSLGGSVYYLNTAKPLSQMKITFDKNTISLFCFNEKELVGSMPLKGCSYLDILSALKSDTTF